MRIINNDRIKIPSLFYRKIMCMVVLPACMCMFVYHMCSWCLQGSEEGFGSPRTGPTGSCKLHVSARNQTHVLPRASSALMTESSLLNTQPLNQDFRTRLLVVLIGGSGQKGQFKTLKTGALWYGPLSKYLLRARLEKCRGECDRCNSSQEICSIVTSSLVVLDIGSV